MSTTRPDAEEAIWRPIGLNHEALAFLGASALNHCQLGNQSGYVDLVLFPSEFAAHCVRSITACPLALQSSMPRGRVGIESFEQTGRSPMRVLADIRCSRRRLAR
jgi:hypothetical protein